MPARAAVRGPSPEVTALIDRAEALLTGPRAAERLDAVQAVVELADLSRAHRQTCVAVLGAYLRQDFDPDGHQPGEPQVRRAALDAIRDHFQDPSSPTTWCGLDVDLTGATFDGGALTGIQITGGTFRLARARMVRGAFDLTGIRVSGGMLSLERARIATALLLDRVVVNDGRISLDNAVLERGGSVSVEHGRFTGGHLTIAGSTLDRGRFSLRGSRIEGGFVTFNGSAIGGTNLCLDDAEIVTGGCYLTNLMVTSGSITFRGAHIAPPALSLRMSTLTGGRLSFEGARAIPTPDGGASTSFEGLYVIPPAEVDWGAWAPTDGAVIDLREQPRDGDAEPAPDSTSEGMPEATPEETPEERPEATPRETPDANPEPTASSSHRRRTRRRRTATATAEDDLGGK
jgi:hypothetical protein